MKNMRKTIEKCPYCNSKVNLTDSAAVYHGKSYGDIYLCDKYPECDAYVGVHKGTTVPLGTMANKELREWRKKAHAVFDSLWKTGKITRKAAYNKLMLKLGLSKMSVDQCKKLIAAFKAEGGDYGTPDHV
jgi:ssDNA-binding Zn-finger/Zn-ribbon topoisomerase 1